MGNRNAIGWVALIVSLIIAWNGCSRDQVSDVPTLVIYFSNNNESPDLELVNEALSAYTMEKLGVCVRLAMPSNYSSTLEQDLADGKQIDVAYCASSSKVYQYQKAGLLTPLDDLLERKGVDILSALNPEYYEFSRVDGSLYALPTNRDRHRIVGFEYNQEIADQYDLDMARVQTAEDLTEIFAKLKRQTTQITPTVVVPGFIQFDQVDNLGDFLGVLTEDSGTNVVNLYETEVFQKLIYLIHDWYQKGYTLDYTQDAGVISYYLSSGTVLGCLTIGKLGFEAQENRICGHQIGFIPLSAAYCPSSSLENSWYAIPKTTTDPEKAMELVNLLYTDPYVANLMMYGIEGVHYERTKPDGNMIYLGNCRSPGGYHGPSGYAYCNQYIAYLWEGYDCDIWEKTERMNQQAIKSPAWGFRFDSAAVAEQIYRCEEVTDYYLNTLYAGTADPEKTLAAFLSALERAGINKIIVEKQRQLDQYLLEGQQ